MSMKKLWPLLFGMLLAVGAHSATVTLTASPTTGISPLSTTMTWTSAGLQASAVCTASGATAWSGTKAANGSAVISLTGGQYTLNLNCTDTTGSADINWTNPSQNTDGSTIPATGLGSLAGTDIFAGPTSGALPLVATAAKGAATFTITGLTPGLNFAALKAFNTEAVRSNLTGSVSTTVLAVAANGSASVTVNVQPKPPVIVTFATAYELNQTGSGTKLGRLVGTVPIGTLCNTEILPGYWSVPRSAVTITANNVKSLVLVAPCAPAA